MTPLQQHMIEDMTVRGLVPFTQRAYLRAVRDLAAYYQRSPDTLSTRDIQRYLYSRPISFIRHRGVRESLIIIARLADVIAFALQHFI